MNPLPESSHDAAKAKLNGARQLVAKIVDIIQESIERDSDFQRTIDRERSSQQWQYFDGFLSARRLDLDHVQSLRNFLREELS